MKWIFTFGSSHLNEFNVNPMHVALVVEAPTENEARREVFDYDGIGQYFCTSYPYTTYIDEFRNYGMVEMSLSDLEKSRITTYYNMETKQFEVDLVGNEKLTRPDMLSTVYEDGRILRLVTMDEVRENSKN